MKTLRHFCQITLATILTFASGCSHSNLSLLQSLQNNSRYYDKWEYFDLEKEQVITVLLFSKKFHYELQTQPNFVVGISEKSDTIGFVDKIYNGHLRKGSRVKIKPGDWSYEQKMLMRPEILAYKKTKENNIFCAVKTVYYGKIDSVWVK